MAKILFVEDEPALQKALGEYLRERGHAVITALDGEAGLELARRERPDLVLLDLILPKVPGLEVLQTLRSDPALAAIPVIVLTNVDSNESVGDAMALGAAAYLVKTNYSLDEVGEKVEATLRTPPKGR